MQAVFVSRSKRREVRGSRRIESTKRERAQWFGQSPAVPSPAPHRMKAQNVWLSWQFSLVATIDELSQQDERQVGDSVREPKCRDRFICFATRVKALSFTGEQSPATLSPGRCSNIKGFIQGSNREANNSSFAPRINQATTAMTKAVPAVTVMFLMQRR